MGAHTRPGRTRLTAAPGRHRGELAPLLDVDVSAAAGRAVVGLATAGAAGAVVVTGAGGALASPAVAGSASATQAGPYAAPTAEQLAELRGCESSDDYSIDTGNGYYGAYQFDLQTWHGLGYSGYPNDASPATQDAAASQLEEGRGWEPWPACSQKLGLTTTSATTARGSLTPPRVLSRTVVAVSHSHLVAASIPAFPGTTLTAALVSTKRADVLVWQSRMARRGWRITVDGYFGPKSARVAQQFAAEKKIATRAGTVNASMWTAAWTAPIT